ncbi:hypothetical protein [[Mycobacterium] appelbergii]|uniref:hypothetical protein n=1 Tax=[Mycobacterium] appelbergii TaxID=2939269 RepID=UPI003977BD73
MKSGLLGTVLGAVLVSATVVSAPPASAAMPFGNYNLHIPDRRDFHTWVVSAVTACRAADNSKLRDCIEVQMLPQPIAKAQQSLGRAELADGRYTLVIDDPFGLRCGDIYYGPTIPTHDVYTWDETTLAGEMVSSFDAGCDGAPGGSLTYPFTLTRM